MEEINKAEVIYHCLSDWDELDGKYQPSIMDDVFIIGYPWGLSGGNEVLPIFKKGSIASEPDVNQSNLPRILVDSRTTEGNSGSPVIVSHSGYYLHNKNSPEEAIIGTLHAFLGIYSGRLTADELENLGASNKEVTELGIVWKEEVIQEIIEGNTLGTKLSEMLE